MRLSKLILPFLCFFLCIQPIKGMGQLRKSGILKVRYEASFGGPYSCSNRIVLEINKDGAIRMFNDTYDSTNLNNLTEMVTSRGGAIPLEQFVQLANADSLLYFYEGHIAQTEYKDLTELIGRRLTDTIAFNHQCCCDIPYRVLKVYFKNGKKKIMECGKIEQTTITALMDFMNIIAYRKGYKKATVKFKVN